SSRFSSLFLRLRACGCRQRGRNDKNCRDACVPLEHDTTSYVAFMNQRRSGVRGSLAKRPRLQGAYTACDIFGARQIRRPIVQNCVSENSGRLMEIEMRFVRLGRNGPNVSEMGLGCMGMSGGYGPADDAESIATIHAALEAGITMLDTGDFYGSGHNEMLIAEALKGGKRERAFIAVKCGAMRGPDLKFLGDDGRPNSVKNFLAYTLRRLGTDHVDLYQPARLDPTVPIEDTIGAIADMVKAGYVRHVGLSEASAKS